MKKLRWSMSRRKTVNMEAPKLWKRKYFELKKKLRRRKSKGKEIKIVANVLKFTSDVARYYDFSELKIHAHERSRTLKGLLLLIHKTFFIFSCFSDEQNVYFDAYFSKLRSIAKSRTGWRLAIFAYRYLSVLSAWRVLW